jgi:endonuclease YncB( thermonuclease family)
MHAMNLPDARACRQRSSDRIVGDLASTAGSRRRKPMPGRWLLAAFGLLAALAVPAMAATLSGRADLILDGDSLLFLAEGGKKPLEVRLQGVDAPESCQAGGAQAREFLASMARDQPATLQTQGLDHYGRTLGVLTVDGLVVNERLVAEGHAWALRSKWDRGVYVAKEKVAIALKRGLHAEPGAIPPWEFRRLHGPCHGASEGAAPSTQAPVKPTARTAPPAAAAADGAFRCDGRTHCSQMRSCAEARYFLAHCPGVKMDGNRDGVPCERQWCN